MKNTETAFTVERLKKLGEFITTMDKTVGLLLALEELKLNVLSLEAK